MVSAIDIEWFWQSMIEGVVNNDAVAPDASDCPVDRRKALFSGKRHIDLVLCTVVYLPSLAHC